MRLVRPHCSAVVVPVAQAEDEATEAAVENEIPAAPVENEISTEAAPVEIPPIRPGEVIEEIDLDEGPRLPRIDDDVSIDITAELEPYAGPDAEIADIELIAEPDTDKATEPSAPLLVPAVLLDDETTTQSDQLAVAEPEDNAVDPSPVAQPAPKSGKATKPKKIPNVDEVTEEIVIEAPPVLWNIEDEIEQAEAKAEDRDNKVPSPTLQEGAAKTEQQPTETPPVRTGAPERRSISATRTAVDVKLVEIPYPKPMKTAAWALGAVLLLLGMVWQVRAFYLTDLAEIPWMRAPLVAFCEYASCTIPARTDIKAIDLVSTTVDPHPVTPGALRVSANLVNRAKFEQQFPPLEVTLTDKEGNTVGRRTYHPHEYRVGLTGNMVPNVMERVDLDLAQPAESAVGYEIQLVAR